MLWGAHTGRLELRREGGETRLRGTFPYGRAVVLSDGGGVERREAIAPRAFARRVDAAGEDIHLLFGHDFDRPLASRQAGSLELRDSDEALELDAVIVPAISEASYARDFLSALEAGLIRGLSPGFRVPQGGETVERSETGLLRTVRQADLFELSAVTRPAYPDAQLQARCWTPATPLRRPRRMLL